MRRVGERFEFRRLSDPEVPMIELYQASRGLEDVVIGDSTISLVAGETGGLVYRGYSIEELVPGVPYESAVHLLLFGEPPPEDPSDRVRSALVDGRSLSVAVREIADTIAPELPPLEALRTLLSSLGDGTYSYPPTIEQGLSLVARLPTLLAGYARRARGLPSVFPNEQLGHVANFLWMLTGEAPSPTRTSALENYFVLLADHGMNASTFVLRVVISTHSDLISGATAALGALKGPLHGGAPARVVEMLDAVGVPENADGWIEAALARRELLYGFGHRAYKTEDPRAVLLKQVAQKVAAPDRLNLALSVETSALRALHERRPDARLYTNVEYWGAIVLEGVGLSRDLFTPVFALARTAGWAAHALEQAADNRLIRPEVRYTGPPSGRKWPHSRG